MSYFFFFFFANVLSFCQRTVSGEESQILLLISVFNLLQYVVSFEENLTSHQHVAGNQRSILIAFPDKRGLSLMLIPPPKKKATGSLFITANCMMALRLINGIFLFHQIWNLAFGMDHLPVYEKKKKGQKWHLGRKRSLFGQPGMDSTLGFVLFCFECYNPATFPSLPWVEGCLFELVPKHTQKRQPSTHHG